jgi:hypothetical protein
MATDGTYLLAVQMVGVSISEARFFSWQRMTAFG